jgi:hypothetical protein
MSLLMVLVGIMRACYSYASTGYALSFTNTNSQVNNPSVGITTTAFTVECWIRPEELPDTEVRIAGQYIGTDIGRMVLGIQSKKPRFFTGFGKIENTGTTLSVGQWYHLAFTRDDTGYARIYVNGVLDSEKLLGTTALPATTFGAPGFIGACLIGEFAELRVWEYARTADQIQSTMYTRAVGNEDALLICLPMNDDLFSYATSETVGCSLLAVSKCRSDFRSDLPFTSHEAPVVFGTNKTGFVTFFTNAVSGNGGLLTTTGRVATTAFTMEGWIRPHFFVAEQQFMAQADFGENRLKLRINDSNGVFRVQFGSRVLDADRTLKTNEWCHYAVTRSNAGIFSVYLNGVLSAARNIGTNLLSDVGITLGNVGTYPLYYPFFGDMSDVRVWSAEQSQAQIQSNMFTRLIGNETNLLYYWGLDEGTGTTVADPASGVNGSISGSYQWSSGDDVPVDPVATATGYALCFTNGTQIVTTSARVTNAAFTVETWVCPDVMGDQEYQVFNQDYGGDAGRVFLHIRSRKPTFQFGSSACSAALQLMTNRWYHIACVREASGIQRVYVNGRFWASASSSGATLSVGTISIGRLYRSANGCFLGKISEVRVWNTARTQKEIQRSMYARGRSGLPRLQYCWPLNQTQSSSVVEVVSGSNGTCMDFFWQECVDLPFLSSAGGLYPRGTIIKVW